MNIIFKGQTKLRLKVNIPSLDFANVQSAVIKAVLPDNTVKTFTASIDVSGKFVYYDVTSASDLPQAGGYKFYPVVTFTDGSTSPGKSYSVTVFNEGD